MTNFDLEVNKLYQECLDKWYVPYDLKMPDRVKQAFDKARVEDPSLRAKLLIKAKNKAEIHYYGCWIRGEIKAKPLGKPMSEEVKLRLREYTKRKKELKSERTNRR